jgi:hypothetical protein
MNGFLAALAFALAIVIVVMMPPIIAPSYLIEYGRFDAFDSARALLLCAIMSFVVMAYISKDAEDRTFLTRLFVCALLLRVFLAAAVFVTNTQQFFGGDAYTYDEVGYSMLKTWEGDLSFRSRVLLFTGTGLSGSGWGMAYLVGAVYAVIGRNMFAVQLVNAVMGAATAPVVSLIARHLFTHKKVSRIAGILVAIFPSLILWSAQGLKDGLIIFLLALMMLATLKLGDRFDLKWLAILAASLLGLLSLRFYVFYMAVAAIGLAFVVGTRAISAQGVVRQVVIVGFLGVAFAYLGVSRFANASLEQYGSLERVQNIRENLADSAQSGFGRELDVSTTEGALAAIPVGMTYLLLAPFPWQMSSLRSLITFPEMLVWWCSIPLLVVGIWYAVRFRLRQVFPILVFISMLTVAYSVFQGNVGTAYRQRSQLLVFYLIFVSVGFILIREKYEDKRRNRATTR